MNELRLDEADMQAIIEDHDRSPRHFGTMGRPDLISTGYNPVCGDKYSVSIRLSGEHIDEVMFEGYGCAISKASSSMMTESLTGRARTEAETLISEVCNVLTRGGTLPEILPVDLESLLGVRRFPGRIKCVTLAWYAARAALRGESSVTTE
jgi:nitrogen fixation protein NifU and related proteins